MCLHLWCGRLDGIPLAPELVAAQVSHLDHALELLFGGRRLVPARQQTVRATLDWSYRLLTEPEQVLFERLWVFVGNWALEAAVKVAAAEDLGSHAMLPLLQPLADSGMVIVDRNPGAARYRLLEVVRQYARERLTMRGPSQTLQRESTVAWLVARGLTNRQIGETPAIAPGTAPRHVEIFARS